MKRFFILLLILPTIGYSQYNLDVGIYAGGANYLGDMGGDDQTRRDFVWDMKLSQTRHMVGAFVRYKVNPYISVNAGVNHGRIQGDDALSTNPGRKGRNLSFRNDITEVYARGELYLYNNYDVGRTGRYQLDFQSYVFAGVGGFYHNPKAQLDGQWYDLRPLKTEGKEYSQFGVSIPAGIGVFFTYSRYHRIGWQMGWRTTFTDYLDDVSSNYVASSELDGAIAEQLANRSHELDASERPDIANYAPGEKRGDPTNNDAYLFTGITYSQVIRHVPTWVTPKYRKTVRPQRLRPWKRRRVKF